jgi:hypothetical protein
MMYPYSKSLNPIIPQVAVGSPPGVWVCSTDMMLGIPPETGEIIVAWLRADELTGDEIVN